MTYREAVAHGEKVLELSHIADAKTDAWLLLEMGCKIDRKFYYMHMEDDLPDDLLKEYELTDCEFSRYSRCSLWCDRNVGGKLSLTIKI